MLGYHLFIAWKSLRRRPWHSLLVVAGIALGVAVATMFSAIHHTYARDPIPAKSGAIHYVRMDSWDPQQAHPDGIPPKITYRDMIGIMKSDIPVRQTASAGLSLRISAGTGKRSARLDWARLCHADFFAMFGLPFRYGSPWDRTADERAEPVVVIDDELNERFFGGEDSVGRSVRIEDREFRVIGVLAPFRPSIRYYDFNGMPTAPPERFFISMSHLRPLETFVWGPVSRWGFVQPGFEGTLAAEFNFLQMWVELPGPAEVAAYRSFLDAYALEQRRSGRFLRPLDNRVTPLLEYMAEMKCPPPEATAMMITANLFLAACALSLMGLLLSRFLARAAETGVRRALGASRWDVFLQHVIECEVVAIAGGLAGLGLAAASLWLVNLWMNSSTWGNRDDVFRMDLTMACFAAAASLVAGLLAGVYPAYRVCRTAPASHLKIQ